MITINVSDGIAVKPDGSISRERYDPAVGTIIRFIAEDGSDYHVIACGDSGYQCHDCVFDKRGGHPLSKLFKNKCGPDVTQMCCYDRIYKPLDTIMEEL
jgi:hypothetical protein